MKLSPGKLRKLYEPLKYVFPARATTWFSNSSSVSHSNLAAFLQKGVTDLSIFQSTYISFK